RTIMEELLYALGFASLALMLQDAGPCIDARAVPSQCALLWKERLQIGLAQRRHSNSTAPVTPLADKPASLPTPLPLFDQTVAFAQTEDREAEVGDIAHHQHDSQNANEWHTCQVMQLFICWQQRVRNRRDAQSNHSECKHR